MSNTLKILSQTGTFGLRCRYVANLLFFSSHSLLSSNSKHTTDDSFVLMEAFRRTSLDDNIVKRSATGMGHAGKLLLFECVCVENVRECREGQNRTSTGTSILITSLTDFVAFMISSTSAFPALQSFCVYAGIGILLLFWFQISVFAPSIVLDELWRRLKGRRDVLCCCSHSSSRRKKSVKKKTTSTDDTTTHQNTLAPNALIRFMDKKYVVSNHCVLQENHSYHQRLQVCTVSRKRTWFYAHDDSNPCRCIDICKHLRNVKIKCGV